MVFFLHTVFFLSTYILNSIHFNSAVIYLQYSSFLVKQKKKKKFLAQTVQNKKVLMIE